MDFCRFCLKQSQNLHEIEPKYVAIVEICFGMTLQKLENDQMCQSCTEFLDSVCDFKLMVLQSEQQLMDLEGFIANRKIIVEEIPDVKVDVLIKEEGEGERGAAGETEEEILRRFSNEKRRKKEGGSRFKCSTKEFPEKLGTCKVCGKVAKNLFQHMKYHLYEQQNATRPVECKECNTIVPAKRLKIHQKTHNRETCPICSKEFMKTSMQIHMFSHRNPPIFTDEEKRKFRKFYCKICNCFNGNLKQHHLRAHAKQEKIPCEFCGQRVYRYDMNRHLRKHKDPYVCDYCCRQFMSKPDIRKHIENLHLQIKEFFCEFCSKSFSTSRQLTKHVKCPGFDKKLLVLCAQCGKGFRNEKAMLTHVEAMHNKTLQSLCQECNASFNTPSGLFYHLTTAHGHGRKSTKQISNFGELSVDCVCGVKCFSRLSFRQHLDSEHFDPEKKRWKCTCGRDYLERGKLHKHFEQYHNIMVSRHREKKKKVEEVGSAEVNKMIPPPPVSAPHAPPSLTSMNIQHHQQQQHQQPELKFPFQ